MISRVRIRAEWLLILLLSRAVVGIEITYEVDVRDHVITRLGGPPLTTAPLLPVEENDGEPEVNVTEAESDESAPKYVMIYSADSPHSEPSASDHLKSHGLVGPGDVYYALGVPQVSDADPLSEDGGDYGGFEVPVTLAPVVSSGGLLVDPPQDDDEEGGLAIAVTLAPVVSSGAEGDAGTASLPVDGPGSPGYDMPSPPTAQPTSTTSQNPSRNPMERPSKEPSRNPTSSPTARPTRPLQPSRAPWISPTYDEFMAHKNSVRGASKKKGKVVSLASGYNLHDGNKDGSDLPPNGAVVLGTRSVTIESNETLRDQDTYRAAEKFDMDAYDTFVLAQEKLARLDTALHMQFDVCFPPKDCGFVSNSTSDFEGAFVNDVCGKYCRKKRYEHTLATLSVCDQPPEEVMGCISFGLTVQLETVDEAEEARREIGAAIAGSFDVFSALLPTTVTSSYVDLRGGPEVVGTSINRVEGRTWYPAWGSAGGGHICSDDGNEPFYMKLNPDEYLADTKVDCCRKHWWWDVRGCADPTALPCPEGYDPVSEIRREGLMAGAFYGVYPNVYFPGCEGVKKVMDPDEYRDELGALQGNAQSPLARLGQRKRRERVLGSRRKKREGRGSLTAGQEERKAEYEAKTRVHRELRQEEHLRRLVERQRRLEKFMRPGARKAPIDGDELVVRRYR